MPAAPFPAPRPLPLHTPHGCETALMPRAPHKRKRPPTRSGYITPLVTLASANRTVCVWRYFHPKHVLWRNLAHPFLCCKRWTLSSAGAPRGSRSIPAAATHAHQRAISLPRIHFRAFEHFRAYSGTRDSDTTTAAHAAPLLPASAHTTRSWPLFLAAKRLLPNVFASSSDMALWLPTLLLPAALLRATTRHCALYRYLS